MQSVIIVFSGSYTKTPISAFSDMKEAEVFARSVNNLEENDDINSYIKVIPFITDPAIYNINDVINTCIYTSRQNFEYILDQMQKVEQVQAEA